MYFDHGETGFPGEKPSAGKLFQQTNISSPKPNCPVGTGSTTLISISGAFGGSEAPGCRWEWDQPNETPFQSDLLENYIPGKCKVYVINKYVYICIYIYIYVRICIPWDPWDWNILPIISKNVGRLYIDALGIYIFNILTDISFNIFVGRWLS